MDNSWIAEFVVYLSAKAIEKNMEYVCTGKGKMELIEGEEFKKVMDDFCLLKEAELIK